MMTGWGKTQKMWRETVRPEAAKGPAGAITMVNMVEGCVDMGAPEYAVTGVARIERISPGQVRVSKYSRRPDGNVILFHEVWDYEVWQSAIFFYEKAAQTLIRGSYSNGEEGMREARRH